MPSLIYRSEMAYLRRYGHLRVFKLGANALDAWLATNANRRPTAVPRAVKLQLTVREQLICGRPCPVLSPANPITNSLAGEHGLPQTYKPVVLFLHGGGFLFEAIFAHWMAAVKMVKQRQAELWLPAYPILPQATAYEALQMIGAVWQEMLNHHPAQQITIVGDSAGATLALMLSHSLKAQGAVLPRQLILLSPGQTQIDNAQIRQQMQAIAPNDVMLALSLLDNLNRLMPERPNCPSYIMRPLEGDFRGFPQTTVYSGTNEILFPQATNLAARLLEANALNDFVLGEGMCHVWPYVPAAPECQQTLRQIIQLL